MRRLSTKTFAVNQAKQDIPPHLVKFLQKTPEQQQRLSAVKAILANEPSARNEMSLDIVYDWMLQNCKQVRRATHEIAVETCQRQRLNSCALNDPTVQQQHLWVRT